MKHKGLYFIIALLGTALAGCQVIEEAVIEDEPATPAEGVWTLKLKATKDVTTKALDLVNGGSTLNAYWTSNDVVNVYKAGTLIGTLDVTPGEGEKPVTATLSGTITSGDPAVDDELVLLIPRADWNYSGQDGSAPSADGPLATLYDYALANVEIASVSGGVITTKTEAAFENQQSVYRFGFKISSAGNPIYIKEFKLASKEEKLVRERSLSGTAWESTFGSLTVSPYNATTGNLYSPSDKFYYMSLRNENTSKDDTYYFTVVGSDDVLYFGTKDISADHLDDGKFISAKSVIVTKTRFTPSDTSISDANDVI